MKKLVITVAPNPGRPGWFDAKAKSDLDCASGAMTVTGNSEIAALAGLLRSLAKGTKTLAKEEMGEPTPDYWMSALVHAEHGGHA